LAWSLMVVRIFLAMGFVVLFVVFVQAYSERSP